MIAKLSLPALAAAGLLSAQAQAATLAECSIITDKSQRLVCYDGLAAAAAATPAAPELVEEGLSAQPVEEEAGLFATQSGPRARVDATIVARDDHQRVVGDPQLVEGVE